MVIKTGHMVIYSGQAISPGMNRPPATIPAIEKIRRVRPPRLRMSILARGRTMSMVGRDDHQIFGEISAGGDRLLLSK